MAQDRRDLRSSMGERLDRCGQHLVGHVRVVEGPIRSLRAQLPAALEPTRPTIQLFNIVANDAGIAVQLTCTRGDGRLISSLVEVWIYPTGPNDWSANIKAEIDLDDRNGD